MVERVLITDRGSNIVKALENNVRLSCADHLINNVIGKATDLLTPDLTKFFKLCSKLIRYAKKSDVFRQHPSSLKADCPIRWNTKHEMCNSILVNIGQLTSILQESGQTHRLEGITTPLLTETVKFLKIKECNHGDGKITRLDAIPCICLLFDVFKTVCSFAIRQRNNEDL